MTLTDAGPLIAMIDSDDPDHQDCLRAAESLDLPLVTTWPAFTEAMHIVARRGGVVGQQALWTLTLSGRLEVVGLSPAAFERSAVLMAKYADRPMDLADATLVALAEERGVRRVFTLDNDFLIYRIRGRTRFQVIPSQRRN